MAAGVREVVVKRAAADAAKRGHPWVWKHAVARGLSGLAAGDEVQVAGEDGEAVGRAIADPESPIALRMWTEGRTPIDDALAASRVTRAIAMRETFLASARHLLGAGGVGETNAYRVCNGEGDRCPGYVVDRYDWVAVLRVDGDGALANLDRFTRVLWRELAPRGVRSLLHRERDAKGPPAVLRGEAAPGLIEVREHGVPFVVDLARGQKTGAFLDQRENRRRVCELSRGRRVLNLFSYAGGFSLRAALGGAVHVTSVDIAAAAHATAQASFKLAGVDPRAHAFVTADAFAFLDGAKKQGKQFDLIVSDPPSFAPNEKALPRALSAYRALHRACADVLAPDGIFCASSCSSHVDAAAFVATLDVTALRLFEQHGQPFDHPTLPVWPEGRYLKFCILA